MTPPPDRPADFTDLAGLADGELDPAARRAAEARVAADPAAAAELRGQERFSRANADFWAAVEPPAPAAATWAAVRTGIADRVRPAKRPPRRRAVAVAAAVLALAGIGLGAWFATGERRPRVVPAPDVVNFPQPLESLAVAPREVVDPLAEFAVLPMAGPRDVLVAAVPGGSLDGLPAADHPLPDDLPLAAPGDVRIEAVGSADGMFPALPRIGMPRTGPPMIYAGR